MKKFFILAIMLFSFSAFAGTPQPTVDLRGLTEHQIAVLSSQAESMKSSSADKIVGSVDKYVDVGERIGKMMGGAAKEVGIAVNDFVKTPVGLMTAGLIVWHYMGGMLVHVIMGMIMFAVTFGLLFWYSRRLCATTITRDIAGGRNWLGQYPVITIERSAIDDDAFGVLLFGYFISIVISMWIMFSW